MCYLSVAVGQNWPGIVVCGCVFAKSLWLRSPLRYGAHMGKFCLQKLYLVQNVRARRRTGATKLAGREESFPN